MSHEANKCKLCQRETLIVAGFVEELREAGFSSWFTVVHEALDVSGSFWPTESPDHKMAIVLRLEWLSGHSAKSVVALLSQRARGWRG